MKKINLITILLLSCSTVFAKNNGEYPCPVTLSELKEVAGKKCTDRMTSNLLCMSCVAIQIGNQNDQTTAVRALLHEAQQKKKNVCDLVNESFANKKDMELQMNKNSFIVSKTVCVVKSALIQGPDGGRQPAVVPESGNSER